MIVVEFFPPLIFRSNCLNLLYLSINEWIVRIRIKKHTQKDHGGKRIHNGRQNKSYCVCLIIFAHQIKTRGHLKSEFQEIKGSKLKLNSSHYLRKLIGLTSFRKVTGPNNMATSKLIVISTVNNKNLVIEFFMLSSDQISNLTISTEDIESRKLNVRTVSAVIMLNSGLEGSGEQYSFKLFLFWTKG